MWKRIIIGGLAALSAACSAGEDTATAEAEVERFHRLLDEERYDRIYESTNDELRRDASEREFTDLLRNVRTQLGDITRAERQGWGVNYVDGTTRVSLTYRTEGETGSGSEEFVWVLRDGRDPELAGYTVNARANSGTGGNASGDGEARKE